MKIIQFVPTLESGGVEQGVLEISKALVDANHESHVVSAGGRLVEELIRNGAQHHTWELHKKSIFTFKLINPLRKWIEEMKPDILHVRSRMPAWIVWRAVMGIPKNKRPKIVSTIHGLYSVNFYSAVMAKPSNIITVSNSAKNYLIQNYKEAESKNLKLIYRGVDSSEYYQGYKPSEDWLNKWYLDYPETKDSKLLTIAGRISPLKDFEKIINLTKSIVEKSNYKIKVLIAGEAKGKHNKYLNNLNILIKSLGLESDIYFLGYRRDVKDIYAISSIVFNTSNKPESFGRSILEPLSIGVPSIGYNRGGVQEILEELYPYGAVEPDDAGSMLQKSLSILDGNNTKIKENKKFLKSNMCQETINFYKEIIT
jgi:glycosyltransferase involved in cell wall biosynthesis